MCACVIAEEFRSVLHVSTYIINILWACLCHAGIGGCVHV